MTSVAGKPFRNWLNTLAIANQLNSKENIIKEFPPDQFAFDARAIKKLSHGIMMINDLLFGLRI
ncbi:MAG: hypothetical protein IPL12_06160 [Bacteroidetes bacterium]|nr:hypothetical protein [Bacteroidota bacterium]